MDKKQKLIDTLEELRSNDDIRLNRQEFSEIPECVFDKCLNIINDWELSIFKTNTAISPVSDGGIEFWNLDDELYSLSFSVYVDHYEFSILSINDQEFIYYNDSLKEDYLEIVNSKIAEIKI